MGCQTAGNSVESPYQKADEDGKKQQCTGNLFTHEKKPLCNFNPQRVLGVVAIVDICCYKFTTADRAWSDLVFPYDVGWLCLGIL